ncbi:MAG: YfhO family protein [Chloroflexi bacterium]|nr:YfhO family protein [Chloroflexota bacterium]
MANTLRAFEGGSTWRELATDVAHILALGILSLVFFWRLITPFESQRMFLVEGDFTNQYYPYRTFVSSELSEGRLPLWSPYILAGHPVVADSQSSVFYPLGLLLTPLLPDKGSSLMDIELRSIVHYFLAAIFTYLFVKRLTKHRFAGLLAGIVFSFGGYLLSYPGLQVSILETATWLPLTLLFINMGLEGRRHWLPAIGLAGATQGMAILAGHPQIAMYSFYTGLMYILYLAFRTRWPLSRMILACVCFTLAAVATAAVLILPALELTPLSTRSQLTYDAASHGFEFNSMLGIILADWRNEKALYVGIAPLILTLQVVIQRVSGTKFWAGVVCLSLVLSFGGKTPVFPVLFAATPGFAMFRDQERIAVLFALSMSVLTGYGIAWIDRAKNGEAIWRRLRVLVGPAGIFGGASGILFLTQEWRTSDSFLPGAYGSGLNGYQYFVLFTIASFALVVMAYSGKVTGLRLRALMIALVAADLFIVNWSNNIVPDPPTVSRSALATMEYIKAQPGVFRIRLESDQLLPSNYPGMFGIQHVGGDTPISVGRIDELLTSTNEWKIWQLFNVDYVVTRKALTEGLQLVYSNGDFKTYRMLYGLPRAYAVTQFRVADNPAEALKLTASDENHPGDLVILEERPSFVSQMPGAKRPTVEVIEYSPQRIVIAADGDVDALLVVSDAYYPGWQATIDGSPTRIYVANYAFRAVELPAGEHVVEMVYDPISFRLGGIISGTAWAFTFGLAAFYVFWRKP